MVSSRQMSAGLALLHGLSLDEGESSLRGSLGGGPFLSLGGSPFRTLGLRITLTGRRMGRRFTLLPAEMAIAACGDSGSMRTPVAPWARPLRCSISTDARTSITWVGRQPAVELLSRLGRPRVVFGPC